MNYYCYSYFTFVNFVIFSCWTIPAQDKLKKLQIDFSSGCQISWFSAQNGFQGVQMCCTAQEWQLEGGSKEFHKPNFRLAKSNLGADFRISDKIRERILKHEREWFYSWLQESCINEASSNFSPALCSHPLHWTVSHCCLGCLAQQIAGPQPKKGEKSWKEYEVGRRVKWDLQPSSAEWEPTSFSPSATLSGSLWEGRTRPDFPAWALIITKHLLHPRGRELDKLWAHLVSLSCSGGFDIL